jgi:hypothetical protein
MDRITKPPESSNWTSVSNAPIWTHLVEKRITLTQGINNRDIAGRGRGI